MTIPDKEWILGILSNMSTHDSHSKEEHLSTSSSEGPDVARIHTTGDHDEYVMIGNQKFFRHELMSAFGGTLNPGLAPVPVHKFGNPAPLGLSAFSLTTFVLSCYNAQAMGISSPKVVVGLAAFYGGAIQMLAGIWEIVVGNTFGGTALTSYGAFWLSYAAINISSFGIVTAYAEADETSQVPNAIGFFLLGWAIFTFMLASITMKSTVAFCALFYMLAVTFVLLAAGEFSGKVGVTRAGGVFGIITAFIGFYNAFAGTATPTNSYITARAIPLTRA